REFEPLGGQEGAARQGHERDEAEGGGSERSHTGTVRRPRARGISGIPTIGPGNNPEFPIRVPRIILWWSGQNGEVPGYRRQLYRDDAVVLRAQKLGESDRIITLLTRRHGRVRAVARGVRRTTSRFGARLEPFGHVDVQLAGAPDRQSSALQAVTQVEGINLYGKRFLSDYARYTTASAIAETAERLTPVE